MCVLVIADSGIKSDKPTASDIRSRVDGGPRSHGVVGVGRGSGSAGSAAGNSRRLCRRHQPSC